MVIVNGKVYQGNNLVISNNKVFIDGKEVSEDSKTINIEVQGNVQTIKCDAVNTFKVNGDVGSIQTASGDIDCGNVNGSVTTMSGDVTCGKISGNVSTMSGNIKHK